LRYTGDDALRRVGLMTGLRETGKLICSSGCRDWKAPRSSPGCRDRILRYTLCLQSRLPGLEGAQIKSRLPGPDIGRFCKTDVFCVPYIINL